MDYENQHTISLFINTIRTMLIKQGLFEHHLYSTLPYKIENTDTFKLKNNLYMRYNPEPDIWQVGKTYDNFFWIGSMFRKERRLSKIHQYEFTVVDIYRKQGAIKNVITEFLGILSGLEKKLSLKKLSKLKVKYMTYSKLPRSSKFKESFWMVLTDYPMNQSFYDTRGKSPKSTSKFEIFFVDNGRPTEIAACGVLGENLNKQNYIKGRKNTLSKTISQKKFIGFGFGIERLARIYGQLK